MQNKGASNIFLRASAEGCCSPSRVWISLADRLRGELWFGFTFIWLSFLQKWNGRSPVSQSWDGLSVSVAKDREWGSYLPRCTAFKFCVTWFEMFWNVYAIGQTCCEPSVWLRFAPLKQRSCWVCFLTHTFLVCTLDKLDAGQGAFLSVSSERSPGRDCTTGLQ